MPSSLHQTVIDLLRHAPGLVPQLLALAGAAAPPGATVRLIDPTLDQISRRVDLAVEVEGADGEPLAVGVEIQLGIKPAKLLSWPVYVTTMRTPERPSACLLVIAPDRRVAAWAARPIHVGPGNESFHVHVIGPDDIPRITTAEAAREHPEMGFLSALAHAADDGDLSLVGVALEGLSTLDSARARSYGLVLLGTINQALSGAMEAKFMNAVDWDEELTADVLERRGITPEFVERAFAWARQPLSEEDRQSMNRYVQRERAREAAAESRGKLLAKRELLARFLTRAGLQPSAEQQARIDECTDPETLDRWIDQAIGASSVEAVLR